VSGQDINNLSIVTVINYKQQKLRPRFCQINNNKINNNKITFVEHLIPWKSSSEDTGGYAFHTNNVRFMHRQKAVGQGCLARWQKVHITLLL